ncbi:hypothetical protein HZS_4484 [Henneguya salminicola]|nr:hypothetical protein HZS_4484 [Henneguya salminicola]
MLSSIVATYKAKLLLVITKFLFRLKIHTHVLLQGSLTGWDRGIIIKKKWFSHESFLVTDHTPTMP